MIRIIFLLAAAIILFSFVMRRPNQNRENRMQWRGEWFNLTKQFEGYDEFKNTPQNLDPSELPRIEKLMQEGTLPTTFPTAIAFQIEALKFKFPGYGFGSRIDEQTQPDGTIIHVAAAEIPGKTNTKKYFVAQEGPKGVRLIDDYVGDLENAQTIRIEAGKIIYSDANKNVLREVVLARQVR